MSRARFRLLAVFFLIAMLGRAAAAQPAPQQPPAPAASQHFSPQDVIPFDSAVQTGTLPNGLRYYVRRNARPAQRVSLRLAVKAGSLDESDDEQGLAHMLEHMAFNGSAHFKPGQLVSYFESTGARLGPHVNAYTSFEETVYMLDLPTDKPDIVEKGVTAMADFAGGMTLDPKEIDKERGVVIEEWRGGLGAQSRVRDKQIPVLYYHSRYADRLPIGKPDIIRTFKPELLRKFYDTYYRPDRMAIIAVGDEDPQTLIKLITDAFGGIKARAPEPPPRNADVPLPNTTLVSVVTDPELTQSSVTVVRKRPREDETHVADYRRDLVQRFFEQMLNDRFDEISRRPDARFLGAGIYGSNLSPKVETVSLTANVPDGHILDGLTSTAIEAKRAREYGFSASELDRTKKWMQAFYERAYSERDKTESSQFADEYLNHFLEGEPSPGIAYEYALVRQLLPGIAAPEVSAMGKALLADESRVVLAVSPQKPGIAVPTDDQVRAALASADAASVTPWHDTTATRDLLEKQPEPAAVTSRKTLDNLGVTIVHFANGVEAWFKPTDFKNDQVLFSMYSNGGLSLAPPADFIDASLATSYVSLSGAEGLKALDIQKMLAGKLASASPYVSLSNHGFSGSASPADLETALQLLYARFTAPGDDPDAFEVMKRQLTAAVANRLDNPERVWADKVEDVNTSHHYISRPLTPEDIASLDRAKMEAFYKARFSNAADFTFFMVGAFKVDDVLPLVARYVGGLPSTGAKTAAFKDLGIHFPAAIEKARVVKGTEPRSQTVVSFFADPPIDPMEQERVSTAADILELSLRDLLREELGQTYTVGVDLSQPLPQRGDGHIEVEFGAAPENIDKMVQRVLDDVQRLQKDGPSEDLLNRAKETSLRNYQTALKQNAYWLGRLQTVQMFGQDPSVILTRVDRINALTVQSIQETFRKYFPMDRYTVVTLVPASAGK